MAFVDACWFTAGSSGAADFSDGTALTGFRNLSGAGAVNGQTYSYRAESLDRTQWEQGSGVYSSGAGTLARTTVTASSTGSKVTFSGAPIISLQPMKADLDALGSGGASDARPANASGSSATTTATTVASSTTVTLAAAIDFVDGQGIRINNAGAAFSASNPAALSVSPQGATGSTTYTYTVAGISGTGTTVDGGVGAAITPVSTTTGNATLARNNYNYISWTAGAGCIGYAVYKSIGGTQRLIGFTTGTSFNDFGEAAINAPDWLPSIAPGASLNKWLIASIVSGGGTTSLVLSTAPSRSASGLGTLHSDTFALQNWVTTAGSARLYLVGGFYRIETAIELTSGANFCGAGRDLTTIFLVNPFQWGVTLTLPSATSVMSMSAIKIAGQINTDTGGAVYLTAPSGEQSYSALFDGVSFNDSAYGLYLDRASSYKFVNSDVKGQHVAGLCLSNLFNADAGDGVIANNFISIGFGALANIHYKSGGGLKVIGNKLLSQPTASYGILLDQTAGTSTAVLIIANNSIEGQYLNGILAQNGTGAVWSNVSVTGNELAGQLYGITINGASGWLNNLTITGNSCQQNKTNGITVSGATNYTITGNVCTGTNVASTIGILGQATAFNGAVSGNAVTGFPVMYSFYGSATVESSTTKTSASSGSQSINLFTLGLATSYTSAAKCDFAAFGNINSVGGGLAFGAWGAAQAGAAGATPTTVVVDSPVQTPTNANNFINSVVAAANTVTFRTTIIPGSAGSVVNGTIRVTGAAFTLSNA